MSHYKNEQPPRGDGPLIRRHRIRDIPLEQSSPGGIGRKLVAARGVQLCQTVGRRSKIYGIKRFWNRVAPRGTRVVDT